LNTAIKRKFNRIASRVESDPRTQELAEEYQRKYGTLTVDDLEKTLKEVRGVGIRWDLPKIQGVMIFDRALSDEEVKELFKDPSRALNDERFGDHLVFFYSKRRTGFE